MFTVSVVEWLSAPLRSGTGKKEDAIKSMVSAIENALISVQNLLFNF
jgi:hypothetical protein